MIRLGLLLFSAYTLGHAHFESVRPQVLDLPLAMFHGEVNAAFDDVSDRLSSLGINMHPALAERHMNRISVALSGV
ncbi:hypothetical protein GCM10007276_17140 [Agaricicola taiwanensis]|uniref:Uncharacterized protein n=1 Tax=Agaricicola taiwanensis TaxID=591372 RepID=A0A8J2W1M4_9RHOB|nr:hypothetical protein [Agaricicola taiwanensis]GGE40377.1 hypothetical protein GCM10007276_17140 [Agaricicola taiwanensis]